MSAVTMPSTGRRATTVVAAIFVSGIALGSFALSFAALSELAAMSGIPRNIAWVWPLIVDGSIVTAMLVIFAWRGASRRETAWPWTTLVFFAVVSIVGNGVHTVAVIDGSTGVSVPFAVFVGAIPPVSLLLSSEMLVRIMTGPRTRVSPVSAESVTEPEPTPEPPYLPVPEPIAVQEVVTAVVAEPLARDLEPANELVTASVADADTHEADVATDEGATTLKEEALPVEEALTGLIDSSTTSEPIDSVVVQGTDTPADIAADIDVELAPESEAAAVEESRPNVWEPTLIEGDGVPQDKASQLQFIIARARAGEDISKGTLADLLEVSDRTAFRRLADAKTLAPDAFGEPTREPLLGVAK